MAHAHICAERALASEKSAAENAGGQVETLIVPALPEFVYE